MPRVLYVAGTNNQIRKYDGSTWTNITSPITISCLVCTSENEIYVGEEGFKANPRIYKYDGSTWSVEVAFAADSARVAWLQKSTDGTEVYAMVEDDSPYGTGYYEAGCIFSLSSGWSNVDGAGYFQSPLPYDSNIACGFTFGQYPGSHSGGSWSADVTVTNHYTIAPFTYGGNKYIKTVNKTSGQCDIYKGDIGSWSLVATTTNAGLVYSDGGPVRVDYSSGYAYIDRAKNLSHFIAVFDCNTDTLLVDEEDPITYGNFRQGCYGFGTSNIYVLRPNVTNNLRYYDGSTFSDLDIQNGGTSAAYHHIDGYSTSSTPTYESTFEEESDLEVNQPFYMLHIEGFPYVWFTKQPSNWTTAVNSLTYRNGLILFPNEDEFLIEQTSDTLNSGIQDANATVFKLVDDDVVLPLLATKQESYENTGDLVNNNIDHGSDFWSSGINALTTDHELTDAPSNGGTVYLGNQTVVYTQRLGTEFTYAFRGKYAVMNDGLDWDWWKPAIYWDTTLNTPQQVSTYPRNIVGRKITLLKNYLHNISGEGLDESESTVVFRGTITAIGDSEDHLGIMVSTRSIIEELERDCYADNFGSALINGYSLIDEIPPSDPNVDLYTDNTLYIEFVEQFAWIGDEDDDPSTYYIPSSVQLQAGEANRANRFYSKIYVGNSNQFETPNDLINAISSALNTNSYLFKPTEQIVDYGMTNTIGAWYCTRGPDNKIKIGLDIVGLRGIARAIGGRLIYPTQHDDIRYTIVGTFYLSPAFAALGFSDYDESLGPIHTPELGHLKRVIVEKLDTDGWYTTNKPNYFHNIGLLNVSDIRIEALGDNEINTAWFDMQYTPNVPIEITEGGSNFLLSPPFNSEKLVMVDDKIVYRFDTIDDFNGNIRIPHSQYDYTHPIGSTYLPSSDRVLKVPETANPEDLPFATQVFNPAAYFEVETDVWEPSLFPLILSWLMSTGSGTNNSTYDVLPRGWGLAIPEQFINIDSFLSLSDSYMESKLIREYYFWEPFKLRDFIESEAKTLGFFILIENGKITAKPNNPPVSGNVVMTIDDSIRIYDAPVSFQSSPDEIINEIVFNYDYDILNDKYRQTAKFVDARSQSDFSLKNAITIENKGIKEVLLNDGGNTSYRIRQLLKGKLDDFSSETYIYQCSVSRKADNLTIGDAVLVTDSRIFNPMTGTRGVTNHLGRVIEFIYNETTGTGDLTVQIIYNFQNEV